MHANPAIPKEVGFIDASEHGKSRDGRLHGPFDFVARKAAAKIDDSVDAQVAITICRPMKAHVRDAGAKLFVSTQDTATLDRY